jgi:phage-related protein
MPDENPTPPAPNSESKDKPKHPAGMETRILALGERWAAETTKIAGFVDSTKNLMENSSRQSDAIITVLGDLKSAISALAVAVTDLKTFCKKRRGIPAVLDWGYEKAKESPQTFLILAMVIITMMALAGAFGWNVSKYLGIAPKADAQQSAQETPGQKGQ